ncbi:MAG: DUF6468 domain-containing protein [Geminicoccaceae bacterium]|nr:DUF6468 domain-containing protein [Geminicoccaceae bacterium]MCX8101763.1 DUF6468 domain-containing protein [Geminicoccaceae bacterium]MDW8370663.1 DUF6468 domain-containing protein [Geminicoccaceae bacterium]
MVTIVLELLLVTLLVVTSVWCVLVHRRLAALRADRAALGAFVDALDAATARAERTVHEMKSAGAAATATIEAQEAALEKRREELDRLVEAAQRMARRLDELLGRSARLAAELRTRKDMQAAPANGSPREAGPIGPPEATAEEATARPARAVDALLEALQKLR